MVENLFEKLPVRRKDFVKSIKNHFQKMVRVVQSYALISVGVKIIVTNTTTSLTATNGAGGTPVGSRQTVFATQSGGKLTDNVSILFGAKFASSLLPIEFSVQLGKPAHSHPASVGEAERVDMIESANEVSKTDLEFSGFSAEGEEIDVSMEEADESSTASSPTNKGAVPAEAPTDSIHRICTVRGLVSKVGLGVGRSDNDRQFTFCNGRPVDLPRFAKTLNEVWRKYEMKQKPAFVLDISVPAGYFDVNLTPDKREVLIVQEAAILAQLREVVDALYLPVRQTMPLNQGMAGGVNNPSWASMFASQTQSQLQASQSEDGADATPIARSLVQSALADFLVTPKDSEARLSDTSNTTSKGSPAEETLVLSRSVSSPAPYKREPVVWMSPIERDRLSERAVGTVAGRDEVITVRKRDDAHDGSSSPKRARIAGVTDLTVTAGLTPAQLSFASQTSTTGSSGASTHDAVLGSAAPDSPRSEQADVPNENSGEEVEYLAKSNEWNFDPDLALRKFKQVRDRKRTCRNITNPPDQVSARQEIGVEKERNEDAFDINGGTMSSATDTYTNTNGNTNSGDGDESASQAKDRLQARVLHKKVTTHDLTFSPHIAIF